MNVVRYIASRYLFSRKHVSLISILTGISIGGITIGTALLIVILSVFNGFFDVIRGYLLSFDPDMRIERVEETAMLFDQQMMDQILDHEEVVSVSPYVEGKVMLAFQNGQNEVIDVRGVDEENDPLFQELEASRENTEYDISVRNGSPGTIVSESLVNRYRLEPGDE